MGIGIHNWRFEVPSQGVQEAWDWLALKVTGIAIRPSRTDPDPPWNLNPDYQRGSVWAVQQQSRFIGHVIGGGVQPPIYVQRYKSRRFAPILEYWTLPEEVIDGQQRLRAIVAFMTGEIPAEVFHDGSWNSYWFRDMDRRETSFSVLNSSVVYLDVSRADRLRFYLRLNGAGVPHTEGELDRVRALLIHEDGVAE